MSSNGHVIRKILCGVVLILGAMQSYGQDYFLRLDKDDGMEDIYVSSLAQDSLGYIWASNPGLLSRYDGYNFKTFKYDPNDSSRTALNFVIGRLYTDASGSVWISEHYNPGDGRPHILIKYDHRKDYFRKYVLNLGQVFVSRYHFERKGTKLWLGTWGDGLFSFDPATGDIEHFTNNHADSITNYKGNRITGISDRDSYLLLCTMNGLWKFDKQRKDFTRPACTTKDSTLLLTGAMNNIVDGPRYDYNASWVLAPHVNGLVRFDKNFAVTQNIYVPDSLGGIDGLDYLTFDRDKDGIFWFPAADGVIRFNPQDTTFRNIKTLAGTSWDVLCDRDQNVWVASDNGISRLSKPSLKVANYSQTTYSSSLSQGKQTDYVIASNLTPRGSDVLLAPINSLSEPLAFQVILRSVRGDAIEPFYQSKKRLWLGIVANDVEGIPGIVGLPIDSISGYPKSTPLIQLHHNAEDANKLKSNSVISVYEDSNEDLWIAHRSGAIGKVSSRVPYGSPGAVTYISGQAHHFFPDGEKSFWIVGDETVTRMTAQGHNGSPEVLFTKKVQVRPSRMVRESDTTLLLASQLGLYRLVESEGGISDLQPIWTKAEVKGIMIDLLGRVWLRIPIGLVCYDSKTNTSTEFSYRDGVEHTGDPNPGRIFKTRNQLMVMGDLEGFTVFDPQSFNISLNAVNPVFTGLQVNNRSVRITVEPDSEDEFATPSEIAYLKELKLDYLHNNFSLEFSAMQMTAPEKNLYRHILEGFDPDWIQTDYKNRTVSYTNLPSGTYTFRLKASNHHGVWSDNERSLKIIILPPPWKTWWAYSIYTLIVLGALFAARRMIVQRERLKGSLKLEKVEREKEHFELEKAKEVDRVKTSFFTNISHEFRTPLTLIQGPVQDLLEKYSSDPKTRDKLTLVQRNSDLLLKLINQLLDLAKLDSGNLKVEKSKGDVIRFIKAAGSSFTSLAAQKNISIHFDVPSEPLYTFFDRDKLETILINLINNAIKFTPPNGVVQINAETENGSLSLKIKDTGIGIPADQHERIFERFHQVSESHKEVGTGIGLALVKELVAVLGGTIAVKSEVGKGSEFTVTLPLEIVGADEHFEAHEQELSIEKPTVYVVPNKIALESAASDGKETRPHILVVEDNADLRSFIIESLGEEFHFLEAENGRQGFEVATTEIPDLIISDVMMPEMDGITMAEKVKTDVRSSHIPLILLTAKSTEASKLTGLESGADDYLTKPFNKQELLLKIRNGITRQRKMREKVMAELMSEAPRKEVLSADEQFLSKVKEEILKQMSNEQLSVESLAEQIGMSRVHLYRKITGLTGMSVNELIRKLRLHRAAQLLEQRWGPISQVAYEVGFSNLSYFSKVFKEEFGTLPSEYVEKV